MGQAGFKVDGAINGAVYLSPIAEPKTLSYGDQQETDPIPLTHLELLSPEDRRSKCKGNWVGTLTGLLMEGWRLRDTDGTGVEGHVWAPPWRR